MELAEVGQPAEAPFIKDLTDDLQKVWKSETIVLMGLLKWYPKLEIEVMKSWKASRY